MFNRRWSVAALLLGISLCIPAAWVIAQDSDPQISKLEEIVGSRYEKVDKWRFDARVVLTMTITIGLLGLVAGGLQSFKGQWVKGATIAVGLIVSSLTLVQNTVYTIDHHQLHRTANRAEHKLEEIELIFPQFAHASSEDWPVLVEEVRSRIALIDALEDQLLTGEVETAEIDFQSAAVPVLSFVAIAEAAPAVAEPAWVTRPPAGKDSLYFVGLGAEPSLGAAKKAALEDAFEQATDYYVYHATRLGPAALDVEILSQRIVESARVESTHAVFDAEAEVWRYYSLLRLERSKVESSVEFFGIEKRQAVEQLSVKLGSVEAPAAAYFSQRKTTYDRLFTSAERTLPKEAWETFEEARGLRKGGQSEAAVEPFSQLVEQHEDFYLGWYNLALALDNLGRYEEAADAYQRAIELEPRQPARDASVYNTYAYLLYRMGRYQEAIEPLERALEIAPEHPKVRRTLQAARRAIE